MYTLIVLDLVYKVELESRKDSKPSSKILKATTCFENTIWMLSKSRLTTLSHYYGRNTDGKDMPEGKHVHHSGITELQKWISAMASLLSEATRLTREESEPFTARLIPTRDQMNNLQLLLTSQPAVFFCLLSGPARDACDKMQLQNISQDMMIADIKLKVLFDSDIQDRHISRWRSIDYSEFRRNTKREEKATRKCIEFMKKYQKDIPDHMRVPALLYNRFRTMLRDNQWCKTLYWRTNSNKDPSSFAQELISAAANHNLQISKKNDVSSRLFHTFEHEGHVQALMNQECPQSSHSHGIYDAVVNSIVAFFI